MTTKAKKKPTTKAKKTTAPIIQIHGSGKIAKIPNDAKASTKIQDFVVDKLKIGSFQLFTAGDDSGQLVRLSDVGSYKGTDLYVKEKNKAQS